MVGFADRVATVVVRPHPLASAAVFSVAFGAAVAAAAAREEGLGTIDPVIFFGVATCGMFAFVVAIGSYVGLVHRDRPLRGVSRRLADAAVSGAAAVPIALAFRHSLWWTIGSGHRMQASSRWRSCRSRRHRDLRGRPHRPRRFSASTRSTSGWRPSPSRGELQVDVPAVGSDPLGLARGHRPSGARILSRFAGKKLDGTQASNPPPSRAPRSRPSSATRARRSSSIASVARSWYGFGASPPRPDPTRRCPGRKPAAIRRQWTRNVRRRPRGPRPGTPSGASRARS